MGLRCTVAHWRKRLAPFVSPLAVAYLLVQADMASLQAKVFAALLIVALLWDLQLDYGKNPPVWRRVLATFAAMAGALVFIFLTTIDSRWEGAFLLLALFVASEDGMVNRPWLTRRR